MPVSKSIYQGHNDWVNSLILDYYANLDDSNQKVWLRFCGDKYDRALTTTETIFIFIKVVLNMFVVANSYTFSRWQDTRPQNVSAKFQVKIPHRSFIITCQICPYLGVSKNTPFLCVSL